jgi:hypothetical protein
VTRGCGYRAEDLFCKALALRGFMPVGTKVKEYKGKRWTKTDHNLDFIFERDRIEYGCEVKNTLGYIDKEELDPKSAIKKFVKDCLPFLGLFWTLPRDILPPLLKEIGIYFDLKAHLQLPGGYTFGQKKKLPPCSTLENL